MVIGLFIALLTLSPKVDAAEQPHFHGKTITLQVGAQAGGRQDRIARTLAKYLTKYTPGTPAFLIQNKSGGQGIPAMLALSKAPTDGSFMSIVISSYLEAPISALREPLTIRGRLCMWVRQAQANSATFWLSINEQESRRWTI